MLFAVRREVHRIDDVEELFARALELHASGRDEEAKAAYVETLQRDATHLAALTNLGTLLYNGGYRTAARTAYRQAVACHPESTMARVNLANALYENGELVPALEHYEAAIALDPNCADAHQGAAYVFEKLGDPERARLHRDLGYRGRSTVVLPYRGTERPTVVLLLVSALGGNVATDRFLDDRRYFTTKLFCEYYDPSVPLPFHELAFNAIGDAELCQEALENAIALLRRTNAPTINDPQRVMRTGRAENARRLAKVPNVVAPRTQLVTRASLLEAGAQTMLAREGFTFPLLVRSPGFHTGEHFVKVESAQNLAEAIEPLPGDRLSVIAFLDASDDRGHTHKYRMLIVGGRLYPLHLAISDRWKVHYFTGVTAQHDEHRAREAAFLKDPEAVIGTAAMRAIAAIGDELGLDYAGVDFAVDAQGRVLLFEANATMRVPDPVFDAAGSYRRAAIENVFAAVQALLQARARGTDNPGMMSRTRPS